MREQFFLDARDYLKFKLLQDLALATGFGLTMVWMLTADKPNGHGSRRPRFDPERDALNQFFVRKPKPRLDEVAEFYRLQGIEGFSYGDRRYFEAGAREEYFSGIPEEFLKRSIVFLDPDNGLSPPKSCTTAHVSPAEVSSLFERLDQSSILAMYQHLPRRSASVFWPATAERLRSALGIEPIWAPFGDVAFYFVSKAPNGNKELAGKLMTRYTIDGLL